MALHQANPRLPAAAGETVQSAGVGVFAEGGGEDGGVGAGEGVGGQVDGLGGAGGDADFFGGDAVPGGEGALERVGFRLGIMADGVEPLAQMRLQRRQIHVAIDVGTEVRHNGATVAEGIVTVTVDHRSPRKIS